MKIFVDMVKASEDPWDPGMDSPKPPTPDATTYGAIITACSRGGQWEMALRFLEDMDKKVTPKSFTDLLVMRRYCTTLHWSRANVCTAAVQPLIQTRIVLE